MEESTFYPKDVLAIHAHPDDLEILAGGTLYYLASLGHKVTVATMTAGDCGTADHSPEEITQIRQNEARQAAAVLGASRYFCLGFGDLAIFNDDPSRRRVTELLRQVQPEIVITAAPSDYHCDHEATSALVRDACFAAPAPNYRTGGYSPILKAIPHLYFCDPDEGKDREGNAILPAFVFDVSRYMEPKTKSLACHESQRAWLKKHHGMDDYLDTMQLWSAQRGQRDGYAYGEGFRQYQGHPYPATPLLQQLLSIPGQLPKPA
ncbi:MAG: PIG-L family deacetylase [Bryobacteraceae bacterium]|nr:PIG-L family deacetylase [Bryobacteraceae bacterium]